MAEETKKPEKIVPLHEDMMGHKHDEASFQKAVEQQQKIKDAIKASK